MDRHVRFDDLQTKGYVVVPSFLSEAQLGVVQEDYANRPATSGNGNYNLVCPSADAFAIISAPVRDMLKLVLERTDIKADTPDSAVYFATGRGINFAWHQDHESFFTQQNHYDYLNFYIPIIKPRRDKTNLSIVPFDVLERECPRTYKKIVRGGAARLWSLRRGSVVFQDDSGHVHFMDKNIDELGITPHLDAGDLLLCRGDLVHRTQDVDTNRVALSVRVCSASGTVTRSRLADGGMFKARMMVKNADMYKRMFMAFANTRREALSRADLNDAIRALPREIDDDGKKFAAYLLGMKLRTGTIGHFLPRAIASATAEIIARRR